MGTETVTSGAIRSFDRPRLQDLQGRRVLLVASTGGHLDQLTRLEGRLGVHPSSEWLTFDTAQSRSLLEGREVTHVDYVAPRALGRILKAVPVSLRRIRRVDAVVSTGAGVALAAVPFAALLGKPAVYIESVSRVHGPSVTGRILQRLPWVAVYTQHESWSSERWQLAPSVLDTFHPVATQHRPLRRLVVTLGTIAPYRFDRLIDAVLDYVAKEPDVEVRWQVGATDRADLTGTVVAQLEREELDAWIDWADAVVTHAGVGSVMTLLEKGKMPLVEARSAQRGEHVDDHQQQITTFVLEHGLAVPALEALSNPEVLGRVMSTRIEAELVSAPVPISPRPRRARRSAA